MLVGFTTSSFLATSRVSHLAALYALGVCDIDTSDEGAFCRKGRHLGAEPVHRLCACGWMGWCGFSISKIRSTAQSNDEMIFNLTLSLPPSP